MVSAQRYNFMKYLYTLCGQNGEVKIRANGVRVVTFGT